MIINEGNDDHIKEVRRFGLTHSQAHYLSYGTNETKFERFCSLMNVYDANLARFDKFKPPMRR
jgi:hypothetical protein